MYFSFNHNLEEMKNTTCIEKCPEFDTVTYILTFTEKVLRLYNEKNAFCLKMGVLLGLKINDLGRKMGCFFVQNPRKEVFFKIGYERGIFFFFFFFFFFGGGTYYSSRF